MLRTRKTKSNNDTIGGSSSLIKGIKGKRTKQKQILNLFIGFAIVFILGVFFSLFVYDIEDLEEASAVSFRDDGKGKLDDESRKKRRRNHEEEEEKEKEKEGTMMTLLVVDAISALYQTLLFDVKRG